MTVANNANAVQYALKKIPTPFKRVVVTDSTIVAQYAHQLYGDDLLIYESMWLLLLDRKNTIVGHVKLSQGGVSGTTFDVKLAAKYAVESLASSCILIHNHPSNEKEPSPNDKKITKRTKRALDLLDIQLLDHVILTEDSYYSFCDEGQI